MCQTNPEKSVESAIRHELRDDEDWIADNALEVDDIWVVKLTHY